MPRRLAARLTLCVIIIAFEAPGLRAENIAERISHVENGLSQSTYLKGWASTLRDRMANYDVPGVSIAVINDYRVEWARGYGVLEAGTAEVVDENTLFQAASISKPVAAVAVLRLVQEGKLDLDEDVNTKLRSWKVPQNALTRRSPVTLRGLLNHSAGVTVHGFPGYRSDARVPSLVEILDGAGPANTQPIRVDMEPGTKWRYSGGGYTIAQQLLIDQAGKPFDMLLHEMVLGPLGMDHSTYEQPLPSDGIAHAAVGHSRQGRVIRGKRHVYPEQAAAGLWTTPSDLARFAIELMQAARGESQKVLSRATAEEMFTRSLGDYGLGLSVEGDEDWLEIGHGGSNAGFMCRMIAFPHQGKGVVVMTNGDRGAALYQEVIRSVARAYGWARHKPNELFAQWDNPDAPGFAVAVVRDGKIVYRSACGAANLEYGIPITSRTIFHVASVSKQFTCFAVALLAQEGKLSFDDEVRRFLPEVPDFGKRITIRHLIHHTSGLRDQWDLLVLAGWRMDDVITKSDVLGLVRRQEELNFDPGERHLYCNTGYTLLGLIVERVSGQSLREFCAARLFEPLGMADTHFHDDHTHIVPNRAYSYRPKRDGGFQKAVLSYAVVGATSLFTTTEDMAKWQQNLTTGLVGGSDLVSQMLERGRLNDGRDIPYAFGLIHGTHRGTATISHSGGDAGFRSHVARFPELRASVVLLGNLSSLPTGELARSVADVVLADELSTRDGPTRVVQWVKRFLTHRSTMRTDKPTVEPAVSSPDGLSGFMGEYRSRELERTWTIARRDDRLVLQRMKHSDRVLRPRYADGYSAGRLRIEFTRDGQGNVDGFLVSTSRVLNLRFRTLTRPFVEP